MIPDCVFTYPQFLSRFKLTLPTIEQVLGLDQHFGCHFMTMSSLVFLVKKLFRPILLTLTPSANFAF